METSNEVVRAPEHYNPNQLVTYKVIDGSGTTYPTSKVTDIEWKLDQARKDYHSYAAMRTNVSRLEDMLPEFLENESDAETIVKEICELFSFNPTKEIEIEGSIRFTGTVSVPLNEWAAFDVNDLDLDVTIESYTHPIEVDCETDEINIVG